MVVNTVGFDFFGTLVDHIADRDVCILSMYKHLQKRGYKISYDDFRVNYQAVAIEQSKFRYETLREVNNCIWVANTLKRMGIKVEAYSPDISSAVENYFNPWKLVIFPDTKMVLERLKEDFKISLVSNFTDSAFLRRSLSKVGIEKFFDHIIDSDAVGWRKPHPNIFKHFLRVSGVKAEEAIFIGDDLETDIKGAKDSGIRAVLLSRAGHPVNRRREVCPDRIVSSLTEFGELLITGRI